MKNRELFTEPLQGATPLEDISGLRLSWVKTQDQLNRAEAEGISRAVAKHKNRIPKSIEVFATPNYWKKVHQDMFGQVWDWAGKWRKAEMNIGVASHLIAHQVQELCDDVIFWDSNPSSPPLDECAALLHHRLVKIHPFTNGNGRHARFISDLFLLLHGETIPRWPHDLHHSSNVHREKYLRALRFADEGDMKPLLLLLRSLTPR